MMLRAPVPLLLHFLCFAAHVTQWSRAAASSSPKVANPKPPNFTLLAPVHGQTFVGSAIHLGGTVALDDAATLPTVHEAQPVEPGAKMIVYIGAQSEADALYLASVGSLRINGDWGGKPHPILKLPAYVDTLTHVGAVDCSGESTTNLNWNMNLSSTSRPNAISGKGCRQYVVGQLSIPPLPLQRPIHLFAEAFMLIPSVSSMAEAHARGPVQRANFTLLPPAVCSAPRSSGRSPHARLIYAVSFFNEWELLEMQVEEHLGGDSTTDVSVLAVIEGNMTFSGEPKPLFLRDALRARADTVAGGGGGELFSHNIDDKDATCSSRSSQCDDGRGGSVNNGEQCGRGGCRTHTPTSKRITHHQPPVALLDTLLRFARQGRFVHVCVNGMHNTPMVNVAGNLIPAGEQRDVFQRDTGIYHVLDILDAADDDIIVIVDADVVVAKESINFMWRCRDVMTFPIVFIAHQYVYDLHWRTSWNFGEWGFSGDHTVVLRAGVLKSAPHNRSVWGITGPTALCRGPVKSAVRDTIASTVINDAAWHFTWFGGSAAVMTKLRASGVSEFHIHKSAVVLNLTVEFVDRLVERMVARGFTLWNDALRRVSSAERQKFQVPRLVARLREEAREEQARRSADDAGVGGVGPDTSIADASRSASDRLAFWLHPPPQKPASAFEIQQDRMWIRHLVQVAAELVDSSSLTVDSWYNGATGDKDIPMALHFMVSTRCAEQYLELDAYSECARIGAALGSLASITSLLGKQCRLEAARGAGAIDKYQRVTMTIGILSTVIVPITFNRRRYIFGSTKATLDVESRAFCGNIGMDDEMCAQLQEGVLREFCH